MGNKDKFKDENSEASLTTESAVKAVKEVALPIPAAPVKRFTFEQWATHAGVKESHKSGLRAFCKNTDKLRTMEEWEKVFSGY